MKPIPKLYAQIAAEELYIETLEVRCRDALDFHDVSVESVRTALDRAFQAGVREGMQLARRTKPTTTREQSP